MTRLLYSTDASGGIFLRKRSWFGMPATVYIGRGLLHRVSVGCLAMPHPGVVNWLLRRGMSLRRRQLLSAAHEFGHLDTAPTALPAAVLATIAAATGPGAGVFATCLAFLGTLSAWEIAAEARAAAFDRFAYAKAYKGLPYWPRLLFWGGTSLAVMAGMVAVLWAGRHSHHGHTPTHGGSWRPDERQGRDRR